MWANALDESKGSSRMREVLSVYAVRQRTHESGIRMAVGADGRSVLSMIMREAVILLAVGLTAGLMLASAAATAASALLFGLRARDPATFLMAPGSNVRPSGRIVSCRCHANSDEWRQMIVKTEKRR